MEAKTVMKTKVRFGDYFTYNRKFSVYSYELTCTAADNSMALNLLTTFHIEPSTKTKLFT
jgi:hypothetical protein